MSLRESWRDKDREEESVDGIAHCDFAKREKKRGCGGVGGWWWRKVLYMCVKTLDSSGQTHNAGMRCSLLSLPPESVSKSSDAV